MAILLTGASGYVGGAISEAAARRGLALTPLAGRLEAIAPGSLDFDLVIHSAGALRYRAAELERANHLGTRALVEGLKRPTKIVFVSSRAVYSPATAPALDESAATSPDDAYGQSKLRAEAVIQDAPHDFIILRPTTLFGRARQDPGRSFLTSAMRNMLAGTPVVRHAPDRDEDFLDVQTFAEVVLRALEGDRCWGATLNVAGPPRSLHGMLETMARVVEEQRGIRPELVTKPGPPARMPPLSTARLEALLGPVRQPEDAAIFADMLAVL